jgi:hypothetical protein
MTPVARRAVVPFGGAADAGVASERRGCQAIAAELGKPRRNTVFPGNHAPGKHAALAGLSPGA